MMTECPDPIRIEALADGEDVENRAALTAHIAECEACARRLNETRALDHLVREAVMRRHVPPAPAPAPVTVAAPAPAPGPRVSRRMVLAGGGALAASVAGLGLALRPGREGVTLDRLTTTYFGDFKTLIAAERRLDITESDPAHLLAWFGERVPFALPRIALREGVSLRGGRLCWLLERRNAALYLDTPDGPCCLYLASGTSLEPGAPVVLQRNNLSGAFWQAGGVMHALIGEPSGETFAALATSFLPPLRFLTDGDAR